MKKISQIVIWDLLMVRPEVIRQWNDQKKGFIANCKNLNIDTETIKRARETVMIFDDGSAEIRYQIGKNLTVMSLSSLDYQVKE